MHNKTASSPIRHINVKAKKEMKYDAIKPRLRPMYFFSMTIPVIIGAKNSSELNKGIS